MFTDDQSTHRGLECLSLDLPEKNRVMASKRLLCSQLMAENSDAACSSMCVYFCLKESVTSKSNRKNKDKTFKAQNTRG